MLRPRNNYKARRHAARAAPEQDHCWPAGKPIPRSRASFLGVERPFFRFARWRYPMRLAGSHTASRPGNGILRGRLGGQVPSWIASESLSRLQLIVSSQFRMQNRFPPGSGPRQAFADRALVWRHRPAIRHAATPSGCAQRMPQQVNTTSACIWKAHSRRAPRNSCMAYAHCCVQSATSPPIAGTTTLCPAISASNFDASGSMIGKVP